MGHLTSARREALYGEVIDNGARRISSQAFKDSVLMWKMFSGCGGVSHFADSTATTRLDDGGQPEEATYVATKAHDS